MGKAIDVALTASRAVECTANAWLAYSPVVQQVLELCRRRVLQARIFLGRGTRSAFFFFSLAMAPLLDDFPSRTHADFLALREHLQQFESRSRGILELAVFGELGLVREDMDGLKRT